MNPTESKTHARPLHSAASAAPALAQTGAPDFLFRADAKSVDPTIWRLAELEEERQLRKLILIASESVCPAPVREVLATSFNNLYTEGYPSWRLTEPENRHWADLTTHLAYFRRYSDLRYYRGCEYADFVESIAQKRIAELFATDAVKADDIFANVQPLSGAAANNAVYMALVPPGSTVVGMSLVEGGHLTHGSPANRSGKNHKIVSYGVSPKTGEIDYDLVKKLCQEHSPRMLIGGASAYPWKIKWDVLREIADSVPGGCYLLADVAHYAGLIAGRVYPNPIGHAHVVSFTTHKSLCGPRGACILTTDREIAAKINTAVFPGEQGGPHQGNIAAKAVAFTLAGTETFRHLMRNVVANSKALAAGIEKRGVKIAYGGTESHLCLVDLNSLPGHKGLEGMRLTGEIAGRLLDLAGVVVNKNTVRGDRSAVHPSAIRLGTVWMSQLGYDERDMDRLAELITTLLKDARPFRYLEGAVHVGRGKVDLDVLDSVRDGVDALVESRLGPPSGPVSGYPHYDAAAAVAGRRATSAAPTAAKDPPATGAALVENTGCGVLEIESERAHYFLASAGTADPSVLKPGDAIRTALFDRAGKLIDDVLVARAPHWRDGSKRYRVITNAANHARVRRWFRALSDGYVLFDDADVFRKVEGPLMVEDLTTQEPHAGRVGDSTLESTTLGMPPREAPAQTVTVFGLFGPDAQKIGASLSKNFAGAINDAKDACFLVVPLDFVATIKSELAGKCAAAGVEMLEGWRKRANLPACDGGERADVAQMFAKRPDLFAREKVWFVGHERVPSPAVARKEYADAARDLPLRKTPLFDEHVKLGNKEFMVPFGGWNMPVRYGSILDEHAAVRTKAGLFDVSHMGVLEVRGPHAQRFLDAITSNYVGWLRDGEAQYSYLLDPDGKCIDDILVYRRAWDRILVVVNASNAEKDIAWIRAAATGEFFLDRDRKWIKADGPVEIIDLKERSAGKEMRVDLALQGPRSFDVLGAAAKNPDLIHRLRRRKRFEFVEGSIDGIDAIVATTGYTGEKTGFEILVHPDHLVQLWKLLLERGAPHGATPCGLGARDSTRTEAGFPLWGHELAGEHDITPLEAGYGGSVKLHKPFFVGRAAMLKHDLSRTREVVRFQVTGKGKRLVRAGNPVVDANGAFIGVVTSNTQVGDNQIGLALVDKKSATRGLNVFIYRLPPPERVPAPKKMSEMKAGDSVLLPETAQIIKRFM